MQLILAIENFRNLEIQLAQAIEQDSAEEIKRIDQEIGHCLDLIIQSQPTTNEDKLNKCSVLLNQLVPSSDRHGLNKRICDAILGILK